MAGVPWAIGIFIMEWAKHERAIAAVLAAGEARDYVEVRNELLDGQINDYEKRLLKLKIKIGLNHKAFAWLDALIITHQTSRIVRNNLVHGYWSGLSENETYILKRKTRGKEETYREYSAKEILDEHKKLSAVTLQAINVERIFQGKEPLMD